MGKGGLEEGCDLCAHEVDFNEPLAVFTCPRADAVKVAWETEAFNASTAKAAIRQCSRLAGLVHCKSDGRERETAFESKAAQLCPWCKDIGVVRFFADTDLTERAALSKHPSAVLDTSRGRDLPEDTAALEDSIFQADD